MIVYNVLDITGSIHELHSTYRHKYTINTELTHINMYVLYITSIGSIAWVLTCSLTTNQ